ncbi:MAG: serine hydrolase [Leptolyngbya sp. RL_3_1]|nr:serine hydrolase [Leptolyngbya sp. RL_3_1]
MLAAVENAEDLAQLEALQQRVQQQLRQQSSLQSTRDIGALEPYFALAQVAYAVDRRLVLEGTAEGHYDRALDLAQEAIRARDRADEPVTLDALEAQEVLWGEAIALLQAIPEQSLLWEQAQAKSADYRQIAQLVSVDVDARQSLVWLTMRAAGPAEAIRISVCHLSGECRHFQGDIPPASPASLIKLPMAVALMHKVTTENIDLDEDVYVDPHNWTENASGAKIFVDRTYPLREVMVRMIKESNNIATNQLVDYMAGTISTPPWRN